MTVAVLNRRQMTPSKVVPVLQTSTHCSDRVIPVVKVTDSWPACHEFEPNTTEDPPCRGDRGSLNVSKLKRPPVVWFGS
ncbi:hypothetical protein TNCV_5062071 [Trichonephila clavipes]|nr:hypothetical protein TNCV_5062071 [Trichonephila clavipes]